MSTVWRQILAGGWLALFLGSSVAAQDLSDLDYLEGVCTSQVAFADEQGEWGEAVTAQATGQTALGGSFYELDMIVPFPGATFTMRLIASHDRFNGVYRVMVLDDLNGYSDIYVGHMTEAGVLVVDNTQTGTGFPDGAGGMIHGRLNLSATETGFELLADASSDGGEVWAPFMRIRFEPRQ